MMDLPVAGPFRGLCTKSDKLVGGLFSLFLLFKYVLAIGYLNRFIGG
jgi:hypothetical protein